MMYSRTRFELSRISPFYLCRFYTVCTQLFLSFQRIWVSCLSCASDDAVSGHGMIFKVGHIACHRAVFFSYTTRVAYAGFGRTVKLRMSVKPQGANTFQWPPGSSRTPNNAVPVSHVDIAPSVEVCCGQGIPNFCGYQMCTSMC